MMRYREPWKQSLLDREEVSGLVALVLMIVIFVGAAVGYVYNLVYIAHWSEGVGMLILRIIGVLMMPLGAILGWIK